MTNDMLNILEQSGAFGDIDLHFARFIAGRCERFPDECALAAALVSRHLGRRHVCLRLNEFAGTAPAFLKDDAPGIVCPPLDDWICALESEGRVAGPPGSFVPLILDGGRLYIQRYHVYETRLAGRILSMLKEPPEFSREGESEIRALASRLFPDSEAGFDWQRAAALAALRSRFLAISGGPGTGKTTTLAAILALLLKREPDLRAALAAPTGKAAARINEALGRALERFPDDVSLALSPVAESGAMTLHRLLGMGRDPARLRHDASNPLPHDLVIIDEASMLDLPLMARLADALKPGARLILLGDRDQLASVEVGALLGDICAAAGPERFSDEFCRMHKRLTGGAVPEALGMNGEKVAPLAGSVIELKKSRRYSEKSGIGRLASLVKDGASAARLKRLFEECDDLEWIDSPPPRALKKTIAPYLRRGWKKWRALIRESDLDPRGQLEAFEEFRVLCALREGPFGVNALNQAAEEIQEDDGLIRTRGGTYAFLPVMVTANDYALGLYNGDVGLVLEVPEKGSDSRGALKACFPRPGDDKSQAGGFRYVSPALLPPRESCRAMTIHKSQGSEFDAVMVVLPDRDAPLVTRELIYTALTRARERVMVLGDLNLFARAVARRVSRASGIAERLKYDKT